MDTTTFNLRDVMLNNKILNLLQVGEMMVFLCSDAASQITGSNIMMDGGWCAK